MFGMVSGLEGGWSRYLGWPQVSFNCQSGVGDAGMSRSDASIRRGSQFSAE